jgi:hypothetical protein
MRLQGCVYDMSRGQSRSSSLLRVAGEDSQVGARQQVQVPQHDELRARVEQRQVAQRVDGEQARRRLRTKQ